MRALHCKSFIPKLWGACHESQQHWPNRCPTSWMFCRSLVFSIFSWRHFTWELKGLIGPQRSVVLFILPGFQYPDLPHEWLIICEPHTWLNRHFDFQREAVNSQRCLEPHFTPLNDSTWVQVNMVCYSTEACRSENTFLHQDLRRVH